MEHICLLANQESVPVPAGYPDEEGSIPFFSQLGNDVVETSMSMFSHDIHTPIFRTIKIFPALPLCGVPFFKGVPFLKRLLFIDASLVADLKNAANKIQTSRDLQSEDMSALAGYLATMQMAWAGRMSELNAQAQSPVLEKQEFDKDLTVEQAAEVLQMSKGHLYKLIRQGRFPVIHVGERNYRIRKSDLLNWNWNDDSNEPSKPLRVKKSPYIGTKSNAEKLTDSYVARIRGPRRCQPENNPTIN